MARIGYQACGTVFLNYRRLCLAWNTTAGHEQRPQRLLGNETRGTLLWIVAVGLALRTCASFLLFRRPSSRFARWAFSTTTVSKFLYPASDGDASEDLARPTSP
jgi:hypothetical protein